MTVSAGLNSVSVYRTVPVEDGVAREDIVGMRVYASTTQSFVADATTLKYSGSSLSYTITGLLGGVTYYVKTALISSFLGDSYTEDDLVITDETPVTTQKAPGSLNVIISTPAVVLQASNAGVVSSYAGSGTTIHVYDGASEVVYDGVGTANGTWKVVATGSGLTVGSITDSGTFITVGDHSNLTVDSTVVTYEITGKTALGSSFSLSATQTLSKAKSGTTGSQGTRGWTIARITGVWNQTSAEAAIHDVVVANGSSPTTPIAGDTVFFTGGAKQYSTSGTWVAAEKFIDGNLVVDGTIIGSHLATEFSIQAGSKVIAGTTTNGVVMDSAKHISVYEGGSLRAKMGYQGASGYGFTAYSPTGALLFDSTKGSALLSNTTHDNYCIGDSTTYPSYDDGLAGTNNIAIGANALNRAGSSSKTLNVTLGSSAGRYLIGGNNVALGNEALKTGSASTTAVSFNVAIGYRPMSMAISSSHCVAVGYLSGFSTTTGSSNTLVGSESGYTLTTANYSTYVGDSAGYSNVTGNRSTYFGYKSGYSNLNSDNTFAGANSGLNSTSSNSAFFGSSAGSNCTANNSTGVGYYAGVTSGSYSVSVGSGSDAKDYAVSVGAEAGATSFGATCMGYQAGLTSSSVNLVSVGYQAGKAATGSNLTIVGYQAGNGIMTGSYNSLFGALSGYQITSGAANSLFGYKAGYSLTTSSSCSYFGYLAGNLNTAANNTLIGNNAGGNTTTQQRCTAVGSVAGYDFLGDNATSIGYNAGRLSGLYSFSGGANSKAGDYSVSIGGYAGNENSTSSVSLGYLVSGAITNSVAVGYAAATSATANFLVSIGYGSGAVVSGDNNTFVGRHTGASATTSTDNTFLGCQAGRYSLGSFNTTVGSFSGTDLTSGYRNTLLGYRSGRFLTSGNNNIFLGNEAGNAVTTASNSVIIGGITSVADNEIKIGLGDGTLRLSCDSSGNWVTEANLSSKGKVGSSTGGTIVQATSRTTGVTLNKPSGEISLFSTTTTANQITTFTLTNSYIGANDVVKVCQKSGTGLYFCHVTNVAAGSCKISIHTVSAVTTAEAPKLSFVVISGAIA